MLMFTVIVFIIGIRVFSTFSLQPADFFTGEGPYIFVGEGARALAPGHTAAALSAVVQIGADGVVLNVERSRDGVLVAVSSPTLADFTESDRLVSQLSLVELKLLNAAYRYPEVVAGPQQILELRQVLEDFAGLRLLLQADDEILDSVCELLVFHQAMNRVLLYKSSLNSFNESSLNRTTGKCQGLATANQMGADFLIAQRIGIVKLFQPRDHLLLSASHRMGLTVFNDSIVYDAARVGLHTGLISDQLSEQLDALKHRVSVVIAADPSELLNRRSNSGQ